MAVPLLGRAERSIPQSPEGRAGRREGLTAKARAERQWCLAITLRRVPAFLLLIPSLKVPITFVQLIPRRSPFAMRHSPHQLISGRGAPPTKIPLATVLGH